MYESTLFKEDEGGRLISGACAARLARQEHEHSRLAYADYATCFPRHRSVGEAPPLGENSYPMTTRRNHYVPVWYQKAFGTTDPSRLCCLDLSPDESPAPASGSSGSRRMERGSPKKFFWSRDLYTTLFFGAPNDEIE